TVAARGATIAGTVAINEHHFCMSTLSGPKSSLRLRCVITPASMLAAPGRIYELLFSACCSAPREASSYAKHLVYGPQASGLTEIDQSHVQNRGCPGTSWACAGNVGLLGLAFRADAHARDLPPDEMICAGIGTVAPSHTPVRRTDRASL